MKPNEPIKNQSGCKSGKCRPYKGATPIKCNSSHKPETPVIAKVEIPDYQPPFEGEVVGFPKKQTNIWKRLTVVVLAFILFYNIMSMKKLREQEKTIDSLIELLEEVTNPLPQGNGEIETPGVLPPKGWIDPRSII